MSLAGVVEPRPPGRPTRLLRLARRQPAATAGVAIIAVFVLAALLAPVVAPYGEKEQVGPSFEAPSLAHPFGLDDGGIDMLTLMLHGARVSLIVGAAAALVAMVIGGAVGVIGGWLGGRVDAVLSTITNYVYAIPDVPLILVIAAIWGRSLLKIVLIIGLIYWASVARVIRAEVKSIRERPFVLRARSVGAGDLRIVSRHVLPHVAALLVALTVLQMAFAIFQETAIAFLGLGDPTLTSWGKLIQNGFEASAVSVGAWWALVPPGIAVVIVVLACTMVGRAIEDALNPRLRVGHLAVRSFRMRRVAGQGSDARAGGGEA